MTGKGFLASHFLDPVAIVAKVVCIKLRSANFFWGTYEVKRVSEDDEQISRSQTLSQ